MNREIKFRAHTKSGIFIVPSNDCTLLLSDTGHKIGIWCSDGLLDEIDIDRLDSFTGLVDKNGTDIYEGDITSENEIVGLVYYDENECCFAGSSIYEDEHDSWLSSTCEVIGNVYENPELLK